VSGPDGDDIGRTPPDERGLAPAAPAGGGAEIDSRTLATTCARITEEKKGRDLSIRHVGPLIGIAEYFVLVTGSSARQVRSIAEEIDRRIRESSRPRVRPEGMSEGSWVLLDFGDVVVHVFGEEARRYYALDLLWADAVAVPLQGEAPARSASQA